MPKQLAKTKKGKVIKVGSKTRAQRASRQARFGVGAKVVELGGKNKGKFAIVRGRQVKPAARAQGDVDRDQVVGFTTKPGSIDENKFRLSRGRFGQGFVIERRTPLTGLSPEERQTVATFDEGTQKGADALNQAITSQQSTTENVLGLANTGLGRAQQLQNEFDPNAALGQFDQGQDQVIASLRGQLEGVGDPAQGIRDATEARAVQAEQDAARTGTAVAGLAELSGVNTADLTDATAQQIAAANQGQATAQAQLAAAAPGAEVIRGEGQRAADAATLATQQQRNAIEAQISGAEQQRALSRQGLQQALSEHSRFLTGQRADAENLLRATTAEREQGRSSLQAGLASFQANRGSERSELIGGIRAARSEAEASRREAALEARRQDLQLLGQFGAQQTQRDTALISATTQRRGQDATRVENLEQRAHELEMQAREIQAKDRQGAAKKRSEARKKRAAARKEMRKVMSHARTDIRRAFAGAFKDDDGRSVAFTKDEMRSVLREEYPELSERQITTIINQESRRAVRGVASSVRDIF